MTINLDPMQRQSHIKHASVVMWVSSTLIL
jgi:hypothetical protein